MTFPDIIQIIDIFGLYADRDLQEIISLGTLEI